MPAINNLKGGRIYFGSWFQRNIIAVGACDRELFTSWWPGSRGKRNAGTEGTGVLLFPFYSIQLAYLWDGATRIWDTSCPQ
jgi:hypothetical protein